MRIVCLGWGSLIWDARELPIQGPWLSDGPFAPVEFSRQSGNGRITLVIDEAATPVQLLWARMTVSDLSEAMSTLKVREGITARNWKPLIGNWSATSNAPKSIPSLQSWAQQHDADAVIWTALGPQYTKQGEAKVTRERPPIEWVLEYLVGLSGATRDDAEGYFRNAPQQIVTEYRRQVEARLGWTYQGQGTTHTTGEDK